ncbi:ABC transporter ATP-binding protein [Allobaculum sp. JKK-2023]|uniref:ABC transporter ATP-binding protein n=1 Tax=Allobaculum sp. JKK-2023 TaxID=3108943 RepID=UPI002B05FD84|nr:ABC transporter ATP-binding protein [Allobaculum sp. JKK-2023]
MIDQNNAIEIRNMTKKFRTYKDKQKTLKEMLTRRRGEVIENVVLDDISLDIKKGETVALIGTNGSGKSTLLKIMTKILYPNSGTVETNGKLTSLLELGAGFHPDFTGRENIYFNAAIFGLSHDEIDKRIDDIIAFSELGAFIDEPVRTYSSGMYMRLAFSVAINVDAEILLIDEILAVGDQHFQNKCFDKLEELRDSDKTIVIVSHSLGVVKVLCSRAVWIYKGKLRLDGDPTYVISKYLEQSAIDNKEEAKQAAESSEHLPRGAVFIDSPVPFQSVALNQPLTINGWSVSNSLDGQVEVLFDEKPIENVTRVPRPDVFKAYQEDYAGFIDEATTGLTTTVDASLLTEGTHRIEVILRDGKTKRQIDHKTIRIKADANPVNPELDQD